MKNKKTTNARNAIKVALVKRHGGGHKVHTTKREGRKDWRKEVCYGVPYASPE